MLTLIFHWFRTDWNIHIVNHTLITLLVEMLSVFCINILFLIPLLWRAYLLTVNDGGLGTKRPREPVSLSSWHLYWETLAMINMQLKLQITYFKLLVGRRKCETIKSGQERVRPDVEWGLKCVLLTKWGHSCMKERTLVGGKMTPTAFFTVCNILCLCRNIIQTAFQNQTSQICSEDLASVRLLLLPEKTKVRLRTPPKCSHTILAVTSLFIQFFSLHT